MKHRIVEQDVSRETLSHVHDLVAIYNDALSNYVDEILYWNAKINLISRGINREELWNHIIHSLCIMYVADWKSSGQEIIDAGSGGGLPGIPLAILTDNQYLLIDLVEKKMLVVDQIVKKLGIRNVQARQLDLRMVESSKDTVFVTKHAFKIYDFLKLTAEKSYQKIIFLKGQDLFEELDLCKESLKVSYIPIEKYHADTFFKGKLVVTVEKI